MDWRLKSAVGLLVVAMVVIALALPEIESSANDIYPRKIYFQAIRWLSFGVAGVALIASAMFAIIAIRRYRD